MKIVGDYEILSKSFFAKIVCSELKNSKVFDTNLVDMFLPNHGN